MFVTLDLATVRLSSLPFYITCALPSLFFTISFLFSVFSVSSTFNFFFFFCTSVLLSNMTSFLDEQIFNADQLTQEIFSLLENNFLFGSSDYPCTTKSDILDKSLLQDFKKVDAGKVRILSIDGNGSTDGILAAKSLVLLESYLCQKSGNSDARIADFFDVVTGSGVGGVLAALIFTNGIDGHPICKATDALQFIMKNHRKLIPSSPKGIFKQLFSSSKVAKVLRQTFGESTLKDTIKPVLIPCYDLSTRAPFLFSRTDALENDSYDFKMHDVCTVTSAAATPAGIFEMSSVDNQTRIAAVGGGVTMNNPTVAAITHVLNNKQEFPFCDSVEDLLVLSLGNGVSEAACAPNFFNIGGEAASDMTDEAVSMAFGDSKTNDYVRIQGNGSVSRKNSNSVGNGKNLLEIAEKMLKQRSVESVLFRGKKISKETNSDKLRWFAEEIVNEQERRKLSVFPTVMFKHSTPRTSPATVSTVSSY